MARCGCAGGPCGCVFTPGAGVSFSGSGSPDDPLEISATANARIVVRKTATLALRVTGHGTEESPYLLTGDSTPETGTPHLSMEIFTESGTWTRPVNKSLVQVTVTGGGGGGAAGGRLGLNSRGGTGGGGGGLSQFIFRANDLSPTEEIIVGLGGLGGVGSATVASPGQNGTAGGTTSFGNRLKAGGGAGGTSVTAAGGWGTHTGGVGTLAADLRPTQNSIAPRGGGYGGSFNYSGKTPNGQQGGSLLTRRLNGGLGGQGQGRAGLVGQSLRETGSGGGGGGAGTSAIPGGNGGNGGLGAGGGGGGASASGYVAGAGGNGGNGVVVVVSW